MYAPFPWQLWSLFPKHKWSHLTAAKGRTAKYNSIWLRGNRIDQGKACPPGLPHSWPASAQHSFKTDDVDKQLRGGEREATSLSNSASAAVFRFPSHRKGGQEWEAGVGMSSPPMHMLFESPTNNNIHCLTNTSGCGRYRAGYFPGTSSDPHDNLLRQVLSCCPLCRWGTWGFLRSSKLPEGTELNSRAWLSPEPGHNPSNYTRL